jgi:hypothetical protein
VATATGDRFSDIARSVWTEPTKVPIIKNKKQATASAVPNEKRLARGFLRNHTANGTRYGIAGAWGHAYIINLEVMSTEISLYSEKTARH